MSECAVCGKPFEAPASKRRTCSRSCAVALVWRNPESAAKRRASIVVAKQTPESRARSTEASHKRWSQPGERERLSNWNRERWADPDIRAQLTAALKATHGTPEKRAFYSAMRTADWSRPSYREKMIAAVRAHHGTPEARAKFSALLRGRWQDPILRAKYLAAVRATAAKMRGPKRIVIHVPLPEMKVHRTFAEIRAAAREESSRMRARTARFKKADKAATAAGKPKSTAKELADLAARSKAPIKRYPMGAHAGWKPTWME